MKKLVLMSFTLFPCCLAMIAASTGLFAGEIKATPTQDGNTLWYDCKDIGVEGKGWTDTKAFYDRLPAKADGKAPQNVWELSRDSTGMCVRFTTDSPTIQVRWTLNSDDLAMPHMPATGVSGVDLYAKLPGRGWRFVGNGRPTAVTNTAAFSVPSHEQCLLYLPLYNGVKSVEIGVLQGRSISLPHASAAAAKKPIVFYGTSITQGGCVSRPGLAATAIVGRKLDVPVINLGFSGNGCMEPEMADLFAELDPSVYVLDCLWNMTPELVAERIEPFVKTLRKAHPDTPILLAEDSSFEDVCPTDRGRILREIIAKLTAEGVKNLHFVAAENMLGDDSEGTVDGCHPNDLGMMRQAEVFVKAITPLIEK